MGGAESSVEMRGWGKDCNSMEAMAFESEEGYCGELEDEGGRRDGVGGGVLGVVRLAHEGLC